MADTLTREMLDDEGENLAVRSFLMQYSCDRAVTIDRMREHMDLCGWAGCWPEFVEKAGSLEHLTKAGAQLWIRHLLDMERRSTSSVSDTCAEMRALCSACGGTGDVHRPDGEYVGECDCAATKAAAPVCPTCKGNDANAPCAYPSEGKPGCLRDASMAAAPADAHGSLINEGSMRVPAEDAREEVPTPPTLPKYLLSLIGDYGMARTETVGTLEIQYRWEKLIEGIKRYATDYANLARRASSVPAIPGTGGEKGLCFPNGGVFCTAPKCCEEAGAASSHPLVAKAGEPKP